MAFHGLLDNGFLYQRFEEIEREGTRLGRHLWLDARSLAHMIENNIAQMTSKVTSVHWERKLVILDQGKLGSCTGNAGTGALGTQPFYDAVGKKVLPSPDDETDAEAFAVKLYEDATVIDGYPGTYPPDDTGSSGLAICKVLKSRGIVAGYHWARSAHGFVQLLQRGPVLQGMPWYNAFFSPGANGFIDADRNWSSSGVAGGHEVEAVGVEIDTQNLYDSVVTYANSWGTGWADNGYFRMRLSTYEQLTGVDLKQFLI
jgi:hypothetical protein